MHRALLSAAKKVVDLLLTRGFPPNTPLLHHIIAFATVVLVRLTSIVDTSDEAHRILYDLVVDRKSSQFDPERKALVEGFDVIAKKFLDHSNARRHSEAHIHPHGRRESEHYNGLAHLAELAVGDSDREYSERQLHKKSDRTWQILGGDEGLDSLVKRQGYLSALQTLLQN